MNEVFQNYKHYYEWISKNLYSEKELTQLIIDRGLVIERKVSCNGEPLRYLTKEEFMNKEEEGFIPIPFVMYGQEYEDLHREAEDIYKY